MPQLDSDTFTYSNGNLATVSSAKWTKLSGEQDCTIASNQLVGSASGDAASQITTWAGSLTLQYSELVFAANSGDGGPTMFSNGVSGFYAIDMLGASSTLNKVVLGSFTALGSAFTTTVGHTVRIFMSVAGTLNAADNGVTVRTVTSETTFTTGKPGVWWSGTGAGGDNWAAGDFSGGSGPMRIPGGFHPGRGPTRARFFMPAVSAKNAIIPSTGTTFFRKTLSPIGSHTGGRSSQNS